MRQNSRKAAPLLLSSAACLLLSSTVSAVPRGHHRHTVRLDIPSDAIGASSPLSNSFPSFSFEPAFWVEFFGNASTPNQLTFDAIARLVERGSHPIIRPGGITMDSMIYDPNGGNPVRTTNEDGGVYRTTVGPQYYESWNNFPPGTMFVSTLNFGNDSYEIARDMAVASATYQSEKIEYFELGNEPTNYNSTRWDNSTAAYVNQWQNWTLAIDAAVNETVGADEAARLGVDRWWASSATTDITGLHVRPVDLIPAGIDRYGQVAQYSIHSYAFSTCDPARAALATTPNILNHTLLLQYADDEIYPSARAALDSGKEWIIGEFNSISCSGQPNVSDTFAQALWVVDTYLIYAVRNASAVHLHNGATLVFQSSDQVNEAGADGTPGFSTYDIVYPVTSDRRGDARALPSFVAQLMMAEAFAANNTQISALDTPEGVDSDHFASYAFYNNGRLSKLALINLALYFPNSTTDSSVGFDISAAFRKSSRDHNWGRHWFGHGGSESQAWVKRMTAPYVNTTDSAQATWAGQSYEDADAHGEVSIEEVGRDGLVQVRGSEAVLIFFNKEEVYGLE